MRKKHQTNKALKAAKAAIATNSAVTRATQSNENDSLRIKWTLSRVSLLLSLTSPASPKTNCSLSVTLSVPVSDPLTLCFLFSVSVSDPLSMTLWPSVSYSLSPSLILCLLFSVSVSVYSIQFLLATFIQESQESTHSHSLTVSHYTPPSNRGLFAQYHLQPHTVLIYSSKQYTINDQSS